MALLVGAVASNPRIGETVFDRLQESRARGIAAFAKVATCLSLTSAAAGALCGQLRDMGDCLSDPRIAHDPVDEVSVAVRDLSGILQGLMTGGENYRMDQAFREGHSSLKMLDRQAIKLQAVASITLINSQTIAGVDLGDYVKSLRNMASELKRGASLVVFTADVGERDVLLKRGRRDGAGDEANFLVAMQKFIAALGEVSEIRRQHEAAQ